MLGINFKEFNQREVSAKNIALIKGFPVVFYDDREYKEDLSRTKDFLQRTEEGDDFTKEELDLLNKRDIHRIKKTLDYKIRIEAVAQSYLNNFLIPAIKTYDSKRRWIENPAEIKKLAQQYEINL